MSVEEPSFSRSATSGVSWRSCLIAEPADWPYRARFEPVPEADQRQQSRRLHEEKLMPHRRPPGVEHAAGEVNQAVSKRDGRAHGNERVHVAGAMAQSGECTGVETAADVDDRDGAGDQRRPSHPGRVGGKVMLAWLLRSGLNEPVRVAFERQPEDDADDGPPLPGRERRFAGG